MTVSRTGPPILPLTLGVALATGVAAVAEGVRVLAAGDGPWAAQTAVGAVVLAAPVVWAFAALGAMLLRRLAWARVQLAVVRGVPLAVTVGVVLFLAMLGLRSLLKHPALAALLASGLAVVLVAVARPAAAWAARRIEASAPWRRTPDLVGLAMVVGGGGLLLGVYALEEQVREAVPFALALCVGAGALVATAAARVGAYAKRPVAVAIAVGFLGVLLMGAPGLGSRTGPSSAGLTASGLASAALRTATDWDGDGVGAVFGDRDCAPWDGAVSPNAIEIVANGIDDNCSGSDAPAWVSIQVDEAVDIPPGLAGANVLFITVDTLRYDRTGWSGHSRPTTPNLDRLAGRSFVFENLQADSSATVSAFSAMWTGRPFYSQVRCEGDVYPPAGGWHHCKLHADELVLPERLQALGMKTAAVVSHNYFTGWGLEQGFDRWTAAYPPQRDLDLVSSEGVTVRAIEELERLRNDRFFLWVHYFDPHARYLDHDDVPTFGTTAIDRYDADIAHTDRFVGVLLNALAAMGLGERTIIVVASDHGEEFPEEHGGTDHTWAVYDTSTRVPWLLHLPGVGSARIATPVSQIDIGPTLVAAAGGQWPSSDREGLNLFAGLLRGEVPARPVFSEVHHPDPLGGVTWKGHKMVRHLRSGDVELYGADDPLNLRDIAHDKPDVVPPLVELQDAWRAHVAARGKEHRAVRR